MVGVPEELGGAVEQRSATTTVLMSEALARGDMGLAVACLAPAAVSTAISLWGDAQQQATYLPEFVGEDVPAAALAVMEPQPLFDPFDLHTKARPSKGGYVLTGVKALVPRAADAELFVIAAELDGQGPSLFIVESKTAGITLEPEPGMGIRAAATGRLILEDVQLPATALLGGGEAETYCRVHRARAPGLVRAGRRHRPGGARVRLGLRQGAQGVRRADLQPPGGGVHRRQHGDRARRACGWRPIAPPAASTRGWPSPARSRSPAACAPTARCSSAPTPCRCSAATASSRSIRSSAGIAICARPA